MTKASKAVVTQTTIEVDYPAGNDPFAQFGDRNECEVRYQRFLDATRSQAWMAIIAETIALGGLGQHGISVSLDMTAIGSPVEDKREQAKAALAAYGHMLMKDEREAFERIAAEDPATAAVPATLAGVKAAVVRMFQTPLPPNARIRPRSNMAEYAAEKDADAIRPVYWEEYAELTLGELAEEVASS